MNIALELLKIKAVFLNVQEPFTWASGIKSPIYCDNRLTLSYPLLRSEIAKKLSDLIIKDFNNVDIIMGTATAGIPHAALIANNLGLPMGYVRSSSKSHGRNNQVEGKFEKGNKVVVIEDLISTGMSSLNVVSTLRELGLEVLGVYSIFSYNLKDAINNFNINKISFKSLITFDELLIEALSNNYIKEFELEKIKKWINNPHDINWLN